MKTTEGVALGLTAFLIYGLARKAQAVGTINFVPDKVHDLKWDGLTPVLVVGFGVQNTSNQFFTVKSLAANLYCNNYYCGNISYFTPTEIKPNSQGILTVNARLSLIGVVNDIIEAWNNGDFSQEIEISGYANVDNLQVPLKFKYKIG